ncbi:hypothetical protein P7C73_g6685, partial [Tremellales sp. Uapishka_1]
MSSPSPRRLHRSSSTSPSTGSILLNAPHRRPSDASIASSASSTVRFAPLPEMPVELKRRSSISLGVAARAHLIGAGSGNAKGGRGTMVMNEDDWETYKKQYESKSDIEPIDVGAVCKQATKSLWRKVRSSSSSGGKTPSSKPGAVDFSAENAAAKKRRDSEPSHPQGMIHQSVNALGIIDEGTRNGDLTPGRRGSPPPPVIPEESPLEFEEEEEEAAEAEKERTRGRERRRDVLGFDADEYEYEVGR